MVVRPSTAPALVYPQPPTIENVQYEKKLKVQIEPDELLKTKGKKVDPDEFMKTKDLINFPDELLKGNRLTAFWVHADVRMVPNGTRLNSASSNIPLCYLPTPEMKGYPAICMKRKDRRKRTKVQSPFRSVEEVLWQRACSAKREARRTRTVRRMTDPRFFRDRHSHRARFHREGEKTWTTNAVVSATGRGRQPDSRHISAGAKHCKK